LFEPPADAVYTIEAAAHLVDLPRRTILVYCKHRLLSPVISSNGSYSFDRKGIRTLRRIEALRPICGPDLAGIKIILALTDQLERLHWEMRSLVAQDLSPSKRKSKSNQQRKQNEWN
jgi:MerR family transcriptional regulator/heat shock protein HspR